MTESGIAELRRLLRNDDDDIPRKLLHSSFTRSTFCAICGWKENPRSEGLMLLLEPAELRQFLTFVLYAETDK